jgi:putative molybdenum carrier protein
MLDACGEMGRGSGKSHWRDTRNCAEHRIYWLIAKTTKVRTRRLLRTGLRFRSEISLIVPVPVLKIVSGGQTGADRAALDWAMAHGMPHGGWCPRGRLAEDEHIADKYELNETPLAEYAERTEWNVRDSDGTVIFSLADELTGGSQATAHFARVHRKPWLHLSRKTKNPSAKLLAFIAQHKIKVLNVAGPRASSEPGISKFVSQTLDQAIEQTKHFEATKPDGQTP